MCTTRAVTNNPIYRRNYLETRNTHPTPHSYPVRQEIMPIIHILIVIVT